MQKASRLQALRRKIANLESDIALLGHERAPTTILTLQIFYRLADEIQSADHRQLRAEN